MFMYCEGGKRPILSLNTGFHTMQKRYIICSGASVSSWRTPVASESAVGVFRTMMVRGMEISKKTSFGMTKVRVSFNSLYLEGKEDFRTMSEVGTTHLQYDCCPWPRSDRDCRHIIGCRYRHQGSM